jgi:hypothetical protein
MCAINKAVQMDVLFVEVEKHQHSMIKLTSRSRCYGHQSSGDISIAFQSTSSISILSMIAIDAVQTKASFHSAAFLF